jgi:hypothetical protein
MNCHWISNKVSAGFVKHTRWNLKHNSSRNLIEFRAVPHDLKPKNADFTSGFPQKNYIFSLIIKTLL